MKSIGEILTAARKAKNLSAAEVSKITKIEPKYIDALERDDFPRLPAATFTKGFIRNYAQVVGKDPDEMIAIFRRDFSHQAPKPKTSLDEQIKPRNLLNRLGWGNLLLVLFGVFIFLGYLGFQYRALIVPPPLEIVQPANKAVLTSPVLVEGKTSADSLVTINDNTDARPDASGVFTASLVLSPGDHEIKVEAVNRFGRSQIKTVSITVISGK